MLPQVVLVDGNPKCVIRPTDKKDLDRFVRNGKKWLQAGNEEAKCTYRAADDAETAIWKDAFALHKAWGGADETFFGIPLVLPGAAPAEAPKE
jgi:hypothetical protein